MTYRKRMMTEKEQRTLDRVAARERKAREAAARREAERKAKGYRTLTVMVPEEIHSAVALAIKELVRKWIAAHRTAELVRPEEIDPLTRALKTAIANVDVTDLGQPAAATKGGSTDSSPEN